MARVLIVEDDADVGQRLSNILAELHEVRLVNNGEEALACAAGFFPDAVLMDLTLPRLGGMETARRMRNSLSSRVRLVAFSGSRSVTREQARAAGFDALIYKPANAHTLFAALEGVDEVRPRYEE